MKLNELYKEIENLVNKGYGECEVISEVDDYDYRAVDGADVILANEKHWDYYTEDKDRIVIITEW